MNELPLHIKKAINRYKEVTIDGLTLYPIKVSAYEEFLQARPALEFMQQSLPIEYMSMPILQAFFSLDFGAALNGKMPTGLFSSALLGLGLSLRLVEEPDDPTDIIKRFTVITDKADPTRLKYIETVINGMEQVRITPIQYAKVREIIAAQNGVDIPDTDDNPELVQAERDLAEQNAPRLDATIPDMVISVAALENTDEDDIYEWAIMKLNKRLEHHQRVLEYLVCGIGSASGATWKGGNPCPNPWFRKLESGSSALMRIEEFAGGQGIAAIQNPSREVPSIP